MKSIINILIAGLCIVCILLCIIILQQHFSARNSLSNGLGSNVDATSAPPPSKALDAEQGRRIFYIDPFSGNNLNAGTRKNAAWKDFTVLMRKDFNFEVTIYLKRGGVWHKPMIISGNKNQRHKIYFDAYGNGESPTIDLQHLGNAGITITRSHVSLRHIRIMNTLKNGITISVPGGLKNIRLDGLEVRNAGKNGIAVSQGGSGLEIRNCYLENIGNNGIHLAGSPGNRLSHVHIQNCHIKKVLKNDGITIHADARGNSAGNDFLLENNLTEQCAEQGFDITAGRQVLLLNNSSKNNHQGGILVGHDAQEITIKGHLSANEPTEKTSAAINLAAGGNNIRVLKSIITGNGYHLLRINTDNVAVFNNTFIYDGGNTPIDLSGKIDNILFVNNIVSSMQTTMGRIRFLEPSRPPSHAGFTFRNNLYHVPGGQVRFYFNQQNYQLEEVKHFFNSEINSQEKNPLFTDPLLGNFHLQDNSPAIDHGAFYTIAMAPMDNNKVKVQNAVFFHTALSEEGKQCVRFSESDDIFTVSDVDYRRNILTLNHPVTGSFPQKISACTLAASIDAGAIEKGTTNSTHPQ